MGANSLTPTCFTNESGLCNNLTYVMPIFNVAAERLNNESPGLNLSAVDVSNLMNMAAYELNSRPYSPWMNVFTLDEWVNFGYTYDLMYYHCYGPGTNITNPVGSVYANATLTLLNQGPEEARALRFSFCHDVDITPVVSALDLLVPHKSLPLDYMPFENPYSSSNIVPMGSHLVLERLSCNATAISPEAVYVRTVLNEAVLPHNECQSGPGFSCPLKKYTDNLNKKLVDYVKVCQVPSELPQYLDFFWNYNTTTGFNYQQRPIPYQEGSTN
jgi:acid phosphatase